MIELDKENTQILSAINQKNKLLIKRLLIEFADNKITLDPFVLYNAIKIKQKEIAQMILEYPFLEMSLDEGLSFLAAIRTNQESIVKMLLADPRTQPESDNNAAIRMAYHEGNFNIVKLLLADDRVKNKLSEKEIQEYKDLIKEC
jgi:hypothetical protein